MSLQLCGGGTRRRARWGAPTDPHEVKNALQEFGLVEILHLTKYPCEGLQSRRRYSKLGRVKTQLGNDNTVSAFPGVVELANVPNTGRDGSAFRVGERELIVTVGSSGSIV